VKVAWKSSVFDPSEVTEIPLRAKSQRRPCTAAFLEIQHHKTKNKQIESGRTGEE